MILDMQFGYLVPDWLNSVIMEAGNYITCSAENVIPLLVL